MTTSWQHPELRLDVAGAELDPSLLGRLAAITLDRAFDRPAACALHFRPDPSHPDDPIAMDSELQLKDRAGTWFAGAVRRIEDETGVDGRVVEVIALDPLEVLQTLQTLEAEEITSIHRFARRMAGRAGLDFQAGCDDLAGGRHLHRFADDLSFLTATAGRYGLHGHCRGRTMHLNALDPARGVKTYAFTDEVVRLRRVREPRQGARAGVLGWTSASDQAVAALPVGVGPAIRRLAVPLRPQEAVDALRAAEERRRMGEAHWLEVDLAGAHNVYPGDVLVDPADGARRMVSSCRISLDDGRGTTTTISTRPPPAAVRPGPAFFLGTVARIGDPDGGGRIMVTLDGLGGVLTGWLPVLSPGGGSGTGFGAPLRGGDPALVAAPDGDPELGFVLGGLLRAGGVQDGCIEGESRTAMVWRGKGLTVAMEEAAGRLALRTDDGSSVELSDGRISLTATDRLDLDCEGRVRIRGTRIDLEEA